MPDWILDLCCWLRLRFLGPDQPRKALPAPILADDWPERLPDPIDIVRGTVLALPQDGAVIIETPEGERLRVLLPESRISILPGDGIALPAFVAYHDQDGRPTYAGHDFDAVAASVIA